MSRQFTLFDRAVAAWNAPMYAVTLWQPWAHAMCHLGKRVENRPWRPPATLLGSRFALHAGANIDNGSFAALAHLLPPDLDLDGLPRKAVVATCRLRYCVTSQGELPEDQRQWFVGPVGWFVDDLRVLDRPVACRGFQKLWRLPDDVLSAVREQEAAQKAGQS